MRTQEFEDFLEDKFMDLREIGGMPIMKDNAEDMFSIWLEQLDVSEVMDFAEEAIQKARIEAKEDILANFAPHISALETMVFATHIEKDELKDKIAGVDFKESLDSLENITGSKLSDMLGKK